MMAGMSKREADEYFGEDGKLHVIKQWIHNGRSYSARRDTSGYIGIISDENYYPVGNPGTDFCFDKNNVDELAKRLGVMTMSAEDFEKKMDRLPMQDDLSRVNCEHAGEVGHRNCGWCSKCDRAKFACVCPQKGKLIFKDGVLDTELSDMEYASKLK